MTMPIPAIDAADGAYRERPIELGKTALLSVDMQNAEWTAERQKSASYLSSPEAKERYFLDRVGDVLIPNQQRLQAAARAAGIEVIYTTIEAYTLDGRDRSLDHKISDLFFPKGSWEARVIDAVGPEPNDIVIPKTASGIFNSTNIEYVLRNLGIEYLIVYGVCTDQCVEGAIRDAADRGFLVTQIEDCCAANEARRHDVSIEQMKGHYCRTRTTDEMVAEIEALAAERAVG
ncbi:cysteine hydrolase family protein [Oceaniradius stylonematis]|uniref:cysteine hydrolase family protein n=1 Tax=Oceaniradius stylonematis TaxID=2184161 RepID=UPI0027401137|nr:isochorismatase family cysteine hydrolase [Oceaniradius stylonematis]